MYLGWGLDPQGQEGLPCNPALLQPQFPPSRPPRAVPRLTGAPHGTVGSAASKTAQVMVNQAKSTCHQARQAGAREEQGTGADGTSPSMTSW